MTPAEVLDARTRLGLTQDQFARVLGLGHRSRVSGWENGTRNPSAQAARLIQAYLDGYRPADWPQPPATADSGRDTDTDHGQSGMRCDKHPDRPAVVMCHGPRGWQNGCTQCKDHFLEEMAIALGYHPLWPD